MKSHPVMWGFLVKHCKDPYLTIKYFFLESTLPPGNQHSTWKWMGLEYDRFLLGPGGAFFQGLLTVYWTEQRLEAPTFKVSPWKNDVSYMASLRRRVFPPFFFQGISSVFFFFGGGKRFHSEGTQVLSNFGQGNLLHSSWLDSNLFKFCLQQGGTWRYCSRCSSQGQSSPLSFFFGGEDGFE